MILTIFYQRVIAFTTTLCHIDIQCHLGIHITYLLTIMHIYMNSVRLSTI
jgi:hypothetical protein